MVIQAFIDESQMDGDVLVLAGYLATAESWAKFSDEWERHLASPPAWPLLKSAGARRKCALDPEFRRRYIEHYEIIKRYVYADICVGFPIHIFAKVADEYGLGRADRNPFYVAFNAMIALYVGHAKKIGVTDPVEFIFDDRTEADIVIGAWRQFYDSMRHRHQKLIDCRPSFKRDSRFMPLQAADFIATWKREEYVEHRTIKRRLGPLLPWDEPEPTYASLYGDLDEIAIRAIMHSRFSKDRYGFSASFKMTSYGARGRWW